MIGVEDGVVDDGGVAGFEIDGDEVAVLGDGFWDDEVLIDVIAIGGDGEGFGHRDDLVGGAEAPGAAVGELGEVGELGGIAFGGAVFGPGGDEVDLVVGEVSLIDEVAEVGSGEPWGHEFFIDDAGDGFGSAFGGGVVQEREGADIAGAMAFGAIFEEDGGDVFGVGWG